MSPERSQEMVDLAKAIHEHFFNDDEPDYEGAYGAGMIRRQDLDHMGMYISCSRRGINLAHWNANDEVFVTRVVIHGDSVFTKVNHPVSLGDDLDQDVFVPIHLIDILQIPTK